MIIKGKELAVPIIQGGMGVGVSLSSLAGAVALQGGMGVISSVNIGYMEADFEENPLEANLRALKRHICQAKETANGKGMIAVNIMTAVSHYEETCRCAVEAGADAIISGAGLPLKLPAYVKDTNTAIAPIVSSAKAAALLCKSYFKKYQVLPDFLVIEGSKAGGHLGFSKEELFLKTAKSNETILEEVLEAIKPYEEEVGRSIPVVVGGGIFDGKEMAEMMKKGASGVQIGTRFIATEECDAHRNFKEQIVQATADKICIIQSPVGMPARAIRTKLLERLEEGKRFPAKMCNHCLDGCQKGLETPYCISRALIEAVKGNVEDGLFFCGENADRVTEIVPVKDLMEEIVTQWRETV